jgi:hypothetical protein
VEPTHGKRKPLPWPEKFTGDKRVFPLWLSQIREKLELNEDLIGTDRYKWYGINSCLGDIPKRTMAIFFD